MIIYNYDIILSLAIPIKILILLNIIDLYLIIFIVVYVD